MVAGIQRNLQETWEEPSTEPTPELPTRTSFAHVWT